MAVKTGVLRVSGRGTNVDFIIDDSAPFEDVTEELREYLEEHRGLWSRGKIDVRAGRRMLSQDQLGRLRQIIETESGLTVDRFWCSPEDLDGPIPEAPAESPEEPQAAAAKPKPRREPAKAAKATVQKQPEARNAVPAGSRKGLPTEALFIKETFRSGESISYTGDVVVLADVNPGAEICANGDIVVFGCLRGFAHAGAAGDTKAAVIALQMKSPRIQIGPYTGLSPANAQGSKITGTGPMIAYVRRRSIYVAPFVGRFARYSRGILYDG